MYFLPFYYVDQSKIFPTSTKAKERELVTIICKTNKPRWHFNNGKVPPNVDEHSRGYISTLYIPFVQQWNSGIYDCHGSDMDGNYFSAESELNVLGE